MACNAVQRAISLGSNEAEFIRESTLNKAARDVIEEKTRLQTKSEYWMAERLGRITASNLCDFDVQARKEENGSFTPRLISILEGTNHFENAAMRYGKDMEPAAKDAFLRSVLTKHQDMRLLDIGLMVHKSIGFLAASPDALCQCRCHGQALLETKCPLRLKNAKFKDVKLEYLEKVPETGQMRLRRSHR